MQARLNDRATYTFSKLSVSRIIALLGEIMIEKVESEVAISSLEYRFGRMCVYGLVFEVNKPELGFYLGQCFLPLTYGACLMQNPHGLDKNTLCVCVSFLVQENHKVLEKNNILRFMIGGV